MATINPVPALLTSGLQTWTWETLTENDTAAAVTPNGTEPLAASVQIVGSFGGATVLLQGSNDNTNWITLKDLAGSDISFSASGAAEFTSAMAYFRVSASGGTSQDVDAILSFRG